MRLVEFPLAFEPGTQKIAYPDANMANWRRSRRVGATVIAEYRGSMDAAAIPDAAGEFPGDDESAGEILKTDVLNKLSGAELRALYVAAQTDDDLFKAIKLWEAAGPRFPANHPLLGQMLQLLVAKGLISPATRRQIRRGIK